MTPVWDLQEVATAARGVLASGRPEAVVRGLSTDSRSVAAGQLFVALRGDRFDGHDFLAAVEAAGAGGAVVQRGRPRHAGLRMPLVEVDDTRAALGRLAGSWRARFALPRVAVAGSNGKTTTKELLATVLGSRLRTLASEGSFNNDIGVPLSLLRLDSRHEAAVFEVGTNHPGELAPLVRLIDPQIGVLTTLGREHMEHFGTLDGVAEEEGWLAELLPASGRFFVNRDAPLVERVIGRCRAAVETVGSKDGCDWRVSDVEPEAEGLRLEVISPRAAFSGSYRVGLLGRHQATNVVLAIAVGAHLGLSRPDVELGLEQCRPPRRRLEAWSAAGIRVLDDAYNANADSVLAALRTLQELPCTGRRIAVLGDMAELGLGSSQMHAEVGRSAATLQLDQLVAVGQMARVMGEAARAAGLFRVLEFADARAAAGALPRLVRPGDVVLVKASRATRLEEVSEALRGIGAFT